MSGHGHHVPSVGMCVRVWLALLALTVFTVFIANQDLGALNTPVVVTYHPAYLLRSPGEKRKAWEDLKFARRVFADLPPAV